jgi:hypothetical protein
MGSGDCGGDCLPTINLNNIYNTNLVLNDASYENFFVLNATLSSKGIICNILLIAKDTPFYQLSVFIISNDDQIQNAGFTYCSSVYINYIPF